MRRACLLGFVAGALGALASGIAQAEESRRIRLSWVAPVECPDEAAVVREVEGFLGQPLDTAQARETRIRGRVAGARSSGFAAELSVQTGSGEHTRTLTHADCVRLTEASALVLALAIDPERVKAEELRRQTQAGVRGDAVAEGNSAPERAGALDAPQPVVAAPAREASPPMRQAARSEAHDRGRAVQALAPGGAPRFSLGAAVQAGGGMLPAVGTGVLGRLGVDLYGLRFVAFGRYWFPRSELVNAGAVPAVRVSLWSAGLRGCFVPALGELAIAGCLGPELGDMVGHGERIAGARTKHDRWSALLAGVEVRYLAARWLVPVAGLEVGWQIERPRFGIRADGRSVTVFRPDPFGIQGHIGLDCLL